MAHTKSAKKRILQSEKNRINNNKKKSMIKTFIKKVCLAILNKNKIIAKATFVTLQSIIDRQASKGLIHKRKAARCKSNLINKINSIK